MRKVALVTGVPGQDSAYLSQLLIEKGYLVYGMCRQSSSRSFWRFEELGLLGNSNLKIVEGDLTDIVSLQKVVEEARPNEVYNLGAMSHVGTSFNQPILVSEVNGLGVLKILETIKNTNTKFVQASTSELYGTLPSEQQSGELFRPRSQYGLGKLYGYWATKLYRDFGEFTCNSICYNHSSKLRTESFVSRKITKAIANIKAGRQEAVSLGNVSTSRDWMHAIDAVNAMFLMLQHDTPGDWVVASGTSHSIKEFLEIAFDYAGLGDYEKYLKIDPAFFRPSDVPYLVGNPERTIKELGWERTITFEAMVKEMVDADIKRYCS